MLFSDFISFYAATTTRRPTSSSVVVCSRALATSTRVMNAAPSPPTLTQVLIEHTHFFLYFFLCAIYIGLDICKTFASRELCCEIWSMIFFRSALHYFFSSFSATPGGWVMPRIASRKCLSLRWKPWIICGEAHARMHADTYIYILQSSPIPPHTTW